MQAFAHNPDDPTKLLPGWELYLPFRKIRDTVYYADKAQSALLQLADICTFIIKRTLVGVTVKPVAEGLRFYDILKRAHYQPGLKSLKPEEPLA